MWILQVHPYTIISFVDPKYVFSHGLPSWPLQAFLKVFYFIRPTPANLASYERWSGTDLQSSTWLGDLVDEVVKVELVEGNTM
jgi:hypothetical protein